MFKQKNSQVIKLTGFHRKQLINMVKLRGNLWYGWLFNYHFSKVGGG